MNAHPLELVVLISGEVELLDADKKTVWTSDGDNEFWEFIDADFCEEFDIDDILSYLTDADIIEDGELMSFENGKFDIIIEEPETGEVIEGEIAEDDDET